MFFVDIAQIVHLGHMHLARFHLGGLGVGDPLDVVVAELALEHRLAVPHPTQAQVANVGFAGHIGHGHFVAKLAAAQVGGQDEGKFISRTKATGPGHGTDHHRTGVLQKRLVVLPELLGMVDRAHRMGVATVRACAGHLVKTQLGTGGDDQVVVRDDLTIGQGDLIAFGLDAGHGLRDEGDAFAFQQRGNFERGVIALAPVDRDPRVGRRELEVVHRTDDGDAVLFAKQFTHFIGGGHAAHACAKDHDMGHGLSPL